MRTPTAIIYAVKRLISLRAALKQVTSDEESAPPSAKSHLRISPEGKTDSSAHVDRETNKKNDIPDGEGNGDDNRNFDVDGIEGIVLGDPVANSLRNGSRLKQLSARF
jgi:hypothetical protein